MIIYKYKCKWCGNEFERESVTKNNLDVPPNAIKCRECGNFIPRESYEN